MGKYFGTDGVRGVANQELTPELAYRLGRVGGHVLSRGQKSVQVLVGRDTRISGELLESALVAGLLSVGVHAIRLGVISTPGVAYLTARKGAQAGVMISASHNPMPDNGIKFFGGDGYKLTDEQEAEIEALLDAPDDLPRPTGEHVGRLLEDGQAVQHYLSHLAGTITTSLEGLRIVVDGAHGAASRMAPALLRQLGAEVVEIGCAPNGLNINDGVGSTQPELLQQAVREQRAHVGLAFDGDADRLIAVDETGEVVDGDFIMAILAHALKRKQQLRGSVVTTVMSNMGLYRSLEKMGISTVQTPVGDRHVMSAMRQQGCNLGGEQSGHIILLDHNTTGDGLLTALHLLQEMQQTGEPLSQLKQVMTRYPQVLVNVRLRSQEDKARWKEDPVIQQALQELEQQLGDQGRLLVRPSGTEPLLRIMAEGPDEEWLKEQVERLAQTVRLQMGNGN